MVLVPFPRWYLYEFLEVMLSQSAAEMARGNIAIN